MLNLLTLSLVINCIEDCEIGWSVYEIVEVFLLVNAKWTELFPAKNRSETSGAKHLDQLLSILEMEIASFIGRLKEIELFECFGDECEIG